MTAFLYFMGILVFMISALVITAVISSGKLDRLQYVDDPPKEPLKPGDPATLTVGGKNILCVIEKVSDNDDLQTSEISLRYLR